MIDWRHWPNEPFLLGLPAWGMRPVTATRPMRTLLRRLTRPAVCGVVFILVHSSWHLPGLYDWACSTRWGMSSST